MYVLAALSDLVENKANPMPMTQRVFELGMRKFADEVDYVKTYVEYLYYTSNYPDVRSALEVALKTVPLEESMPIWDQLLQYEANHGTLSSVGGSGSGRQSIDINRRFASFSQLIEVENRRLTARFRLTGGDPAIETPKHKVMTHLVVS